MHSLPAFRQRAAALGALLGAVALGAACGDPGIRMSQNTFELSRDAGKAETWVSTPQEPITIRLEAPRTAHPGTEVPLRIIVHNGSTRGVAVGFGQRRAFDVLVVRAGGPPDSAGVWSLPAMFSPTSDLTVTDPVPAGRDTAFTVIWPGVDDRGRTVPPGEYRVRATLSAQLVSRRQLWTEWVPITVRQP